MDLSGEVGRRQRLRRVARCRRRCGVRHHRAVIVGAGSDTIGGDLEREGDGDGGNLEGQGPQNSSHGVWQCRGKRAARRCGDGSRCRIPGRGLRARLASHCRIRWGRVWTALVMLWPMGMGRARLAREIGGVGGGRSRMVKQGGRPPYGLKE
jgi:hypothetical protein